MSEHQECHVEPIHKPLDHEALVHAAAVYLAVSGMGCPRCATRVANRLLLLDGVLEAAVFLELSFAAVTYDPERVNVPELVQAVENAGNDGRHYYEARVIAQLPASQIHRQ